MTPILVYMYNVPRCIASFGQLNEDIGKGQRRRAQGCILQTLWSLPQETVSCPHSGLCIFTGGGVYTGGVCTGRVYTCGVCTGRVYTCGVCIGRVYTGGVYTGVCMGRVYTGVVCTGRVYTGGVCTGIVYTDGVCMG